MLKKNHRSIPKNRSIAKIFFYAGLIEQWGSGIDKMIRAAVNHGQPEPIFEELGGLRVTFGKATPHVTPHDFSPKTTEEKVLAYCKTPRSRDEIIGELGLSLDYVRKDLLPRLIRSGKLEYTLPDKPRSKKQKYVGTGHIRKSGSTP